MRTTLRLFLALGSILELATSIIFFTSGATDKALVFGIWAILFHLWSISP